MILPLTDERWLSFVESSDQAHIFHHPAWVRLLCETYDLKPFVIAVFDSDGNLKAGIPMVNVQSTLTGHRWSSLPFTDHCMPIIRDNKSLWELTERLVSYSKEKEIPKMELRGEFPPHPSFYPYSAFVLHTIPLQSDSNLIFRGIHHMHKRNIRKAQKNGIRIESGNQKNQVCEYYKLHLKTRRRQGVPAQPKRFFRLLSSLIIEKGLGFVLLAYQQNICIAGAIFLHWQCTLTYKYGASNSVGRDLGANNLLMWKAIQWGCENGFTKLDMGRSSISNTGLRSYKGRWGADEVPLVYSTSSNKGQNSSNDRLISIMHTLIRNSPTWVSRAVGELLYRHFA